jgi:hypothetical protein
MHIIIFKAMQTQLAKIIKFIVLRAIIQALDITR